MKEKQSNLNINPLNKGLHTDNSQVDSPKGTYRFALNAVNESELGDSGFLSNEESNEIASSITPGYIPIGKIYIGNNNTVIFSVNPSSNISEIGILDSNENYKVEVNDNTSSPNEKLGFRVDSQIQGTYRLRRGCERTIYFVGKGYPPRYYNFDKPEQFKKNNRFASSQFRLYKKLESFPIIDEVKVLNNSGNLISGSYTIMAQFLDEDLNGTEFYELVKDINIYNDSLEDTYADIQGSSNIISEDISQDIPQPYKYPETNKAITISLSEVDKNFTYVRFAFVERTSGTGLISRVVYTEPISVFNPQFTYTGKNYSTAGTPEEVQLFNANSNIQEAQHIEQIDNLLILANTKGEQAKICNLQQYASKIQVDCIVKDIILTSVKENHNAKNPLVVHNGLTFQPGEIYSLGVVYVFDDYSVSPVMHIPGKSNTLSNSHVFSPGTGVYPMSKRSNLNLSETYIDENSSCPSKDFWGLDSEGIRLKNTRVRHHRFPTRDEIGIGFVKRNNSSGTTVTYKKLQLNLSGVVKKSEGSYVAPNFKLTVRYQRNGVVEYFEDFIFPDSNNMSIVSESNLFLQSDVITNIKLYYQEEDNTTEVEVPLDSNGSSTTQSNNLTYKVTTNTITENTTSHTYVAPILGIKLSNVELPSEEEIGKKIIGYQIVKQERRDVDKTILDSAVAFPMLKSGRNVTTAMLAPDYFNPPSGADNSLVPSTCEGSEDGNNPTCYNVSKRNVMLVTPGHKFMDKTFDAFTSIEQVGTFRKEYVARNVFSLQNVYDGTSATGDEDNATKDNDGFSLRHATRFAGVNYENITGTKQIFSNENTRMYNLQAVNYTENEDNSETLYNLSSDNKALVLSSIKSGVDMRTYRPGNNVFPYMYIRKDTNTFYQNFRNNPYYLMSNQVFTESTAQIFGGDTYIAPMRYSNHIFGNVGVALRRKKMSVWALIGSIVIALIGVALAIFTGGTSLVVAGGIILALGAIATGAAAIIEVNKFNEIYRDKWEKNLDRTVFDFFYASLFIKEYPQKTWEDYLYWEDDTFRWMGDVVGDLWFETPLNIALRVPPTNMENNYLKPLIAYPSDRQDRWYALTLGQGVDYVGGGAWGSADNFHRYADPIFPAESYIENYFLRKISTIEPSRTSGVLYSGISTPQVYLVNPDHYVTTGIKSYYSIPLEYDCCSKCVECFPHRIHYSQQSFQEEKSDNYRMFLPNNYKDIEGETGEITNVFRWYNNLYAHTEEALWQMGRNYKERVTDGVVSFIGTGSYFEIPPQKVLDDDTGASAGSRHKWGTLKTPSGIYFISENQRIIYQFQGKKLNPISNIGISNWFRNNIEVQLDKEYKKVNNIDYPNRDNPSNPFGTGFISTYDSQKERIIITKKDFKYKDIITSRDNEICVVGDNITVFENIDTTIYNYSNQGYTYEGIENCKLKFSRTSIVGKALDKEYIFIEGTQYSLNQVLEYNNSWTISYSLKNNTWISWHSYIPNFYISVPEKFYSWSYGSNNIMRYNVTGSYQTFSGVLKPFIVDYTSVKNPTVTSIWESITLQTEAKTYHPETQEFSDERFITFNKAVLYNSRQSSGELNLNVKDTDLGGNDYLYNQVNEWNKFQSIIDRTERDWSINNFRDIRVDYTKPVWISNITDLQEDYYIDKVLNTQTLNINKDWTQLESFRDKYLGIRLIFDKFANKKLIINFSIETEDPSLH